MMRRYKAVMSSVSCLLRQNARQWQNRVPSTPLTNNQLLGSMASFKLHDTYIPSCLFCTQKDGKSTEPPGDELVYEEFYDEDDLESVLPEPDVSISMKRGKEGVYDLQELMTLLRSEQMQDLCAIYVPPEKNYSDYLVIGTGLSVRHIQGIANYVKRIYKAKRSGRDPKTVTIEGHRKAKDWLAMDMGNIVLHLMLPKVRKLYDIESLWTCGPEFDSQIDEETDDIYSLELLDLDLKDFDFGENLRTYQKKNENNATLER